ncbi:hypothetical protein LBMAG42_36830 [Deltaproteobacteria bacterium]|nr:hypothetical protein LBMAG42_36830 [Deltaproteobacteria bacterium]
MNLTRHTVTADEQGVLRLAIPAGRPGLRADVIVTWNELPAEPDPALAAAAAAAELKGRVEALAETFPAAHTFITSLRVLATTHRRLQVVSGRGLGVNLDYRVLTQLDLGRSRAIGFAPAPAPRGKAAARDGAAVRFFEALDEAVRALGGETGGWASREADAWWFTASTPRELFAAVLATLAGMVESA